MAAGIYIHVPFCLSKCPYCDFFSLPLPDDRLLDAYTDAVEKEMRRYGGRRADTLYFGGGTPSLLGGARLARLITAARTCFALPDDAEITLEANPADHLRETLSAFAAAGGTRLSLGMQASDRTRLAVLGRRHTPQDVDRTVKDARAAGIARLSLDMMLAAPEQTAQDVRRDAAVCAELGAEHVSAYLLKIEPGTPFAERQAQMPLPDEDQAANLYLTAVEALEQQGFLQYEISNFALPGRESRHNLKYWTGEPYIGFGPAACSFFDSRRWAYPRDLDRFLNGGGMLPEEEVRPPAGSEEEYAMLRLRLRAGLSCAAFAARFGHPIPDRWRKAAGQLPARLVQADRARIALTPEGFLVSNTLIMRILQET